LWGGEGGASELKKLVDWPMITLGAYVCGWLQK